MRPELSDRVSFVPATVTLSPWPVTVTVSSFRSTIASSLPLTVALALFSTVTVTPLCVTEAFQPVTSTVRSRF